MKVNTVDAPKGDVYTPISISLTFETEDELNAFYFLFNRTAITSATEPFISSKSKEEIRSTLDRENNRVNGRNVNYGKLFNICGTKLETYVRNGQ